ncbi:unnamed protein product [Scytosiphon promiscuus]
MFGRDVVLSYGVTESPAATCCPAPPAVVPFWQQGGNQVLLEARESGMSSAAAVALSGSPRDGVPPVLFTSPVEVPADKRFTIANLQVALETAVDSGAVDESAVRTILLQVSAHASQDGDDTPLHLAAANGQEQIVKLLLDKGAEKDALNSRGRTPLHLAVERAHLPTLHAVLAANPDVNIRYGAALMGYSILDLAARLGNVDVLRALLLHGVDVNRLTDGYTALHRAALNNRVDAIDVLVEAGADIEIEDDDDCTPFLDACSNHCHEAVLALFKHGANIEARDIRGETSLQIAARQAGREGVTEMVDLLLRCGGDETALTPDGYTAAEIVGHHIDYAACPLRKEDAERVRELLANAPADRAWRRRRILVLCRAFWGKARWRAEGGPCGGIGSNSSSGVQSGRTIDNVHVTACDVEDAWVGKTERRQQKGHLPRGGMVETRGRTLSTRNGAALAAPAATHDIHRVVIRVVELAEEGLFRSITRFL